MLYRRQSDAGANAHHGDCIAYWPPISLGNTITKARTDSSYNIKQLTGTDNM